MLSLASHNTVRSRNSIAIRADRPATHAANVDSPVAISSVSNGGGSRVRGPGARMNGLCLWSVQTHCFARRARLFKRNPPSFRRGLSASICFRSFGREEGRRVWHLCEPPVKGFSYAVLL